MNLNKQLISQSFLCYSVYSVEENDSIKLKQICLNEFVFHYIYIFIRNQNDVLSFIMQGRIKIICGYCTSFGIPMAVCYQCHHRRGDTPDVFITSFGHPDELAQRERSRVKMQTSGYTPEVTPAIAVSITSSMLSVSIFVSAAFTPARIIFFCFSTAFALSCRPRLWKKSMSS